MSKENVLRLQRKLQLINKNGSTMIITWSDGFKTDTMVDRFIVLDSENENEAKIMFRSVGYINGGPQNVKTFNFSSIKPDDIEDNDEINGSWYTFEMTDEDGRKYEVEMIHPVIDPPAFETWKKWQKYREDNAGHFKAIELDMIKQYPFASLDD